MITDKFVLDIPVLIISKEELSDVLQHAPVWWGNQDKAIYDNLIFTLPPATFDDVFNEIGASRESLETHAANCL